jgi:hypothetical protein
VTGQVQFGGRDDNTAAGRFDTEDPSGLTPDSNEYRIDGNGPTYRTDPSGLDWQGFTDWADGLTSWMNPAPDALSRQRTPGYGSGGAGEMHALTAEDLARSRKASEEAEARVKDAAYRARLRITLNPDLPFSNTEAMEQARRLDAEEQAREWSKKSAGERTLLELTPVVVGYLVPAAIGWVADPAIVIGEFHENPPISYGKMQAPGDWEPPPITKNVHGQLTNGSYTLDETGMAPHTTGSLAEDRSQFLYHVNEKELVLDAAAYADREGIWVANKAKAAFQNNSAASNWNSC